MFRRLPAILSKFDHSRSLRSIAASIGFERSDSKRGRRRRRLAEYLASALRENGIPSRIPDEPVIACKPVCRPEDYIRAAREYRP